MANPVIKTLTIDGTSMDNNLNLLFYDKKTQNYSANTQTNTASVTITTKGTYVFDYENDYKAGSVTGGRLVQSTLVDSDGAALSIQSQRANNQWGVVVSGSVTAHITQVPATFTLRAYTEQACSNNVAWLRARLVIPGDA